MVRKVVAGKLHGMHQVFFAILKPLGITHRPAPRDEKYLDRTIGTRRRPSRPTGQQYLLQK